VKRAGWFHHTGRLRFNFQNLELPKSRDYSRFAAGRTLASAARSEEKEKRLEVRTLEPFRPRRRQAPLKVDSERGVQATESKARSSAQRRIVGRPAAGTTIRACPSVGGNRGAVIGQRANVGGRTLGGGLGFGLLGTMRLRARETLVRQLGYYGLAWSVFSTVVAGS